MSDRVIVQNTDRADRVLAFLGLLPLNEGGKRDQLWILDDFQKAWVRDIYSPAYEDGRRVVTRAILSIARKNAKSLLTAGLLLCHLCGPEAIPYGQVFSCANDKAQAAVIFKMMRQIVEQSPYLQSILTVLPSTKTIIVKRSDLNCRGSVYTALSSESKTKHGYGPSCFVFDELGESNPLDDLWNTMIDGQQARDEPIAFVLSTQNNDPQHPLSRMIDDGLSGRDPSIVCHLHAADDDCDLLDRDQWIKANPTLLTWKSFRPIEQAASEAVEWPSKEQNFRRRYLNQRVNNFTTLIPAATWRKCLDPATTLIAKEKIYLGLDLAGQGQFDLSALVAVSAENGSRVASWHWKPAGMVEDHSRRDGFDYASAVRSGHLLTPQSPAIDHAAIAMKIIELCRDYEVVGLAYDRTRMDVILKAFDSLDFVAQEGPGNGLRIIPWGQGYVGFSPAVDAFEMAVTMNDLRHDGGSVLTFCVMNALVTTDPSGNRKLDKSKSRFRIDGAVALAMALGLKAKDRTETESVSPFADPEFKYYYG